MKLTASALPATASYRCRLIILALPRSTQHMHACCLPPFPALACVCPLHCFVTSHQTVSGLHNQSVSHPVCTPGSTGTHLTFFWSVFSRIMSFLSYSCHEHQPVLACCRRMLSQHRSLQPRTLELLRPRLRRLSGPKSVRRLPRSGAKLLSWSCCCWKRAASAALHLPVCRHQRVACRARGNRRASAVAFSFWYSEFAACKGGGLVMPPAVGVLLPWTRLQERPGGGGGGGRDDSWCP